MDTTITTDDGLALHVRHWPSPLKSKSLGTVLIVHGLGEHIGRYAHVAAWLNDRGWNAVGYDHRGHGRSEGKRGRIARPDSMLRDLALVVDATRTQYPGLLLLLGHSMGGLIASRFVAEGLSTAKARWHRPVDALMLSSPALALRMTVFQKALLAVLRTVAPDIGANNGLKPEWISHDKAVVAAYRTDPLVHDRVSPKLAGFVRDNGAFVRQRAASWRLPTLLIFAGSDLCVDPDGSREFAATAPTTVISSEEFPSLFHEIFNEPQQATVLATLGEWLATWHAERAA